MDRSTLNHRWVIFLQLIAHDLMRQNFFHRTGFDVCITSEAKVETTKVECFRSFPRKKQKDLRAVILNQKKMLKYEL
jgi:hypothetical protein